MSVAPLLTVELGRVPYHIAHRLQHLVRESRICGLLDADVLLLLEHEPTVTLGRGTRASSLPIPAADLVARGITVAEVERGGDVTWHGPGQLVGYPILHLSRHREDLHWYLRQLEEALIGALGDLGVAAERNPGHTGVWTGGRKIASIGVHVRQWVTTHGLALNISNDGGGFDLIVPCGISGVRMTSVLAELGGGEADRLWRLASDALARHLARVFTLRHERVALERILPGGMAALEQAHPLGAGCP